MLEPLGYKDQAGPIDEHDADIGSIGQLFNIRVSHLLLCRLDGRQALEQINRIGQLEIVIA